MAPAIRIDVSPIVVAAILLIALVQCGLLTFEVGKELRSDNCTRHDRTGPWVWFYVRMHAAVAGAAVSAAVWLVAPDWFAMTSSAVVAALVVTYAQEKKQDNGADGGAPSGGRRNDLRPNGGAPTEVDADDESEVA